MIYSCLAHQLLYTEVIMENSPPGVFILKISAIDPDIGTNGQISFTLHGPNADKFHLDPQTGNSQLSSGWSKWKGCGDKCSPLFVLQTHHKGMDSSS